MVPQVVGIDEVVAQIRGLRDVRALVLVGIDGAGGAGKSTLAAAVAERLTTDVAIVPMDDFIVRDRMLDDSWEHGWDRERLICQVLDPLRRGERVSYQRLEWESNSLSAPVELPVATIVLVEGITALHPDLASCWDLAVWVETIAELARERGRVRDAGNENAQHWHLWSRNDAQYRAKYVPQERAHLVVRGE